MVLDVASVLSRSFVISVDQLRLASFYRRFAAEGLSPLPKHFMGHTLNPGKYPTIGYEQGSRIANCSRSHYDLVAMAKATDMPYICVFEDDALPCTGVVEKLANVLSDIPDDIGILRLGYINRRGKAVLPNNFRPDIFYSHSGDGSQAQIIFSRHYDRYISAFTHVDALADGILDVPIKHPDSEYSSRCLSVRDILFAQGDYVTAYPSLHGDLPKVQSSKIGVSFNFTEPSLTVNDINVAVSMW